MIDLLKSFFAHKGSHEQSVDDELEDFVSIPKTDAELEQWCSRLSGPQNKEVRQLIQEAQCMRWSARILLERLRADGTVPEESKDGALKLAAWWVDARKDK